MKRPPALTPVAIDRPPRLVQRNASALVDDFVIAKTALRAASPRGTSDQGTGVVVASVGGLS